MSARAVPVAVVAGLFIASLAMRPQILAIGPLLPLIRADLGLPAGIAGLLTTIPVLCMGVFAPAGPRLAARFGASTAFAACLVAIVGFGVARALAPSVPLLLLGTLGIGIAIGSAGAIPSMIVAQRMPTRPALGTGAYAGGIVAGSTLASGLAVPLAVDDDWRRALMIISLASLLSVVAWLVLVGADRRDRIVGAVARHLPWRDPTGWLLVVVFGLQSVLFYGVVSWLPNAFVERGWSAVDAGALIAVFNGVGLLTTVGLPLVADRLGIATDPAARVVRGRGRRPSRRDRGTGSRVPLGGDPRPVARRRLPARADTAARCRRRAGARRFGGRIDAARWLRPVVDGTGRARRRA